MRAKSLLTLCIVGGLSLVRPQQASALSNQTDLDLVFTGVANPVSADYAVFFSDQGGQQTFEGYAPLATIPTGDSMQSIVLAPTGASQTDPAGIEGSTPIDALALLGVYTSSTNAQGITFGLSTAAAALGEGQSYDTVTGGLTSNFPTEAKLVTNLQNFSQKDINTLLSNIGTPIAESSALISIGGSGSLLSFSNGTLSGSLTATIPAPSGPPTVPVPPAGWMAALTLALIAGVAAFRKRLLTA